MSLPVEAMAQTINMENPECARCATCIDNCEQEAIHYFFK